MSSMIKDRYSVNRDFYTIRSTDTQRTIETARIQAESLFENSPEIKVEPLASDYEMHLDKKNCKLLKKMVNHAKNSEH